MSCRGILYGWYSRIRKEVGEYKVAGFASREADSALSNGWIRSPEGIQSKIRYWSILYKKGPARWVKEQKSASLAPPAAHKL
jgi:hypothetical protein